MLKLFEYEGRLEWRDIEPGVPGDCINLLDHPDSEEYNPVDLADTMQQSLGMGFVTCAGPIPGRYRITLERVDGQ